jgi:hypothetical protein
VPQNHNYPIGTPSGTPEQWRLSITLNSETTPNPGNIPGLYANAAIGALLNGREVLSLANLNGNLNGIHTRYIDVTVTSGSSIGLGGFLSVDAEVSAQINGAVAEHANASNSAAISLESLTPGATFTSASGLTYGPFVEGTPEPSFFWLTGAVLVAVLFRIHRQKDRKTA